MNVKFVFLQFCAIMAGFGALFVATDGFRVLTSEGARRLEIESAKPLVPVIAMTDQDGARFSLSDYRGLTVLIEFIYTRCPAICGLLGEEFGGLQDRLERSMGKVALLSVSFDPTRDDVASLRAYGERFGAKAPLWRVAAPSAADLKVLFAAFGVVVVPDGLGGFTHNAAISVVDPGGRLVRVIDSAPSPRLLEQMVVRR